MRISEFQRLMRELYFENDSRRGVQGTFQWLVEEVGELARAIREGNREKLEKEFADVLAWIASLANLLAIDLEAAAKEKYSGVCPRCRGKPCECSA